MTNEKTHIYFTIAVSLLFLGLANGLHFFMPYEHVSPYEYFSGEELSAYLVLNIFVGGVAVPLIAIGLGYLIAGVSHTGMKSLMATLAAALLVGVVQAILIFGYDVLVSLALVTAIGCLFLKSDRWVTLFGFLVLFIMNMMLNGLGAIYFDTAGPSDIIYTDIQEVNSQTSVFSGSDIFAIIGMNLQIFWEQTAATASQMVLTILPYILFGISFHQFNVMDYVRKNAGIVTFLVLMILGGGFSIKLLQVISVGSQSAMIIAETIGGGMLAIGFFISLMGLSVHLPVGKVFAPAGRRGLTVYILMNIVMMIISYGFGFQYYGELSVGGITAVVAVTYVFLISVMHVFRRYNIKSFEDLILFDLRK